LHRFLLAAPAAFLLFAACGGDDNTNPGDGAGPTATLTSAERTKVALTPVTLPTVKDQPLPTPVKLGADDAVVSVVAGREKYQPKTSDFSALPTTEITVGGTTYKGVTLAALAEKVKAASGANVTIEGTRSDRVRFGTIRFPSADIAATTVLVPDDTGHLSLYSTTVPQDQWLVLVTGISFN
jgi:hypothetical protein